MTRTYLASTCALACLLSLARPAAAQQPAKAPALPPINPALARLDQVIRAGDGPGFCLAYHAGQDRLAAGFERGTVQVWNRDVLLGFRPGSGSGNKLAGHQGPVVAAAWTKGPV